jgi:hypothetical protein
MNHAAVMNSCDEKLDRAGLVALTEAERVVTLVSRANFEIELGGLCSFFYNSSGQHAAHAVSALNAIGATRAEAALRSAIARFPGGVAPTQQDLASPGEWQQVLGSLGDLDSEYYKEEPDVFSRLCAFIDAHESELQHHR